MQIRHSFYHIFLFLFCFSFTGLVKGQEKVTISVAEKPLNAVLNEITETSKIRFAYDNDYFSGILVSFSVNNMEIEDFVHFISREYPVGYKLIGGTWVLFKVEKPKIVKPKPVYAIKKDPKIIPEKRKAPDYMQPRIYYFSGKIYDAETGEAIKYCQVAVRGGKSVLTDEHGEFSSEIVSTGKVVINVGHLGYIQLDTLIELENNPLIEIDLHPVSLLNFHQANIKATKFGLDVTDKPELIAFNGNASMIVPSLFPTDLNNLYASFPGVLSTGLASDGWLVRGSNPAENVIYIDGIPLYEPNFLFGNQSFLNSAVLQQSFFSRGGYSLDNKGGISGMAMHQIKSGYSHRPFVQVDANLLDASVTAMLPVGKNISFAAELRKSLVEYWPGFLFRNLSENVHLQPFSVESSKLLTGRMGNTNASYFDFNAKLQARLSDKHEISFSAIGNRQSNTRDFIWNLPEIYSQQNSNLVTQYGGNVQWYAKFKPNWLSWFNVNYLDFRKNSYEHFSYSDVPLSKESDENVLSQLDMHWRSEIHQKHWLHYFGAGFQQFDFKYNFAEEKLSGIFSGRSVLPFSTSALNRAANVYYQARFNVTHWMRLKAGAKAVYDFSVSDFQLLPNGSVEIYPFNGFKLYYLTGRYLSELSQTIRFDTDLSCHSIWYLPDNGTFFSSSYHNIAGLNFNTGGFLLNVEAYSKTIDDKPVLYAGSSFNDTNENVTYKIHKINGLRQGVDLFAQYRHSIFSHTLAYSIARNTESVNSINSNNPFWSFNDRLHVVKISEVLSYKGWLASFNWTFATGIPYLALYSTPETFSMGRSDNYSRLDFSVIKQFKAGSAKIQVGVALLNLLDRKNVNNIEYSKLHAGNWEWSVGATYHDVPFSPQAFLSVRFE
ncbi:MAG: TonB-dependent receptor [Prolixibacteraceae bacterium]|nr:TonB-dependent receptor [Prolixibacteraceae bacterium]